MKRKIISILLCTICFASILIVVVNAAYYFKREANGSVEIGSPEIVSKEFLINDNELSDSERTENALSISDIDRISCYATKKGGYADESDYYYLNQLGFKFTFTTTVSVYVRIHIADTWLSRKVYTNGSITENYINKGTINGESPFSVNDSNWKYVQETGYVYLKFPVSATTNELGESETHTYTFDVNKDYFYTNTTISPAFRESVIVETNFYIDIVQANRAGEKWGINNLNEFLNS